MPRAELRRLDALRPRASNPRTHSSAQIQQLAASIRQFGFTNPILIAEDGEIVAGHGRFAAAKMVGLIDVPCLVLDRLTEQQRRAYVIADNQLALNAGWDDELLAAELRELEGAGFDLDVLGFGAADIDRLLVEAGGEAAATEEDVPEPPAVPVSMAGDLWILGRHRLLCGDCTRSADVAALLGADRPHLMVTDPPYGVNYDPAWRVRTGLGGAGSAVGKVLNDDRADWREAWELFPGDVAYVWHAATKSVVVSQSLQACRFQIRAHIVWIKQRFVISRGHYHPAHEPAFFAVRDGAEDHWQERFEPEHDLAIYAVREGGTGHWNGSRKQSDVWHIEHVKSDTGHGTQKPIEAMRRPILNNSKRGDLVYDPFLGSGTTLMAAELTGRVCRGLELNPAYADVIVKRWQQASGRSAVLDATGATFDATQTQRARAAA